MRKEKEKQVFYYHSFTDDFVLSQNQDFALPEDYVWVKTGFFYRLWSAFLYAVATVFAFFYGKLALGLKIVRNADLRKFKDTGVVLYGNHTQPMGDVFTPILLCRPKRGYTIASTANLGIPVIGKILPPLGALPLADDVHGMSRLLAAVRTRLEQKATVIVFPEAHVWPWYTEIRPFPASAFSFPVDANVPAFCATATYQRRRHRKKPRLIVYLDGPFYPDEALPKIKRKAALRDAVHAQMVERSKLSDCRYIEYLPAEDVNNEAGSASHP